ncbi:phosphatidylserine decarboxylase [Nakamurella sp. YIM 132087]|uniref:Phosphatidylserine decarboxylase proenzyme n=1 Tax=Nakamurella alba TaxID=2665158 RepID=A0A7K1FQ21_9ACTN|nr:phosphatidylserine decarboxylase [Nakamurella alba]MTD16245.1 phosphatidylserine decarboxylase [Nakamurella alba]
MTSPGSTSGNGGGSHLAALVRSTVPPMHPGGRPIVLGILAGSTGARFLLRLVGLRRSGRFVGRTGAVLAAASAAFFRAPKRVAPTERGLVVAAADGLVSLIEEAVPPPELGLPAVPRTRVSVFLSVFDVHVQRIPLDGTVTAVAYKPGKFLSADLDKASEVNERNSVVIAPADGGEELVVTQIAGLVARRIVCGTAPGAAVHTGETYGLIRFGSRVDHYLPAGATVAVALGQRTIGGETVVARLAGS